MKKATHHHGSTQHQQWRRHFKKIFHIQNQFNESEIIKARQRPIRHQLAEMLNMDRLTGAIGRLKNGKAGGLSGILPEMVIKAACCEEDFLELLLDLVQMVWKESEVPKDWSDTLLVLIPKKGDLSKCENWRGIALVDIFRKVVARINEERLQTLADEEPPESLCAVWFQEGTWML